MEVTVGNRGAEVVGRKPRGQAEGSGKQTFDRRNTEPAERPRTGGKRAGRREAQSPSETCEVEPDGVKGKNQRLTWGELLRESEGEVSRSHSSEEGG